MATAATSKETEKVAAGRLTGTARTGEDWETKMAAAGWKRVETAATSEAKTAAARQRAKTVANWECHRR